MLSLILLIFAFVLFMLAAFVSPVDPWRGRLACLGLACWSLAEILNGRLSALLK